MPDMDTSRFGELERNIGEIRSDVKKLRLSDTDREKSLQDMHTRVVTLELNYGNYIETVQDIHVDIKDIRAKLSEQESERMRKSEARTKELENELREMRLKYEADIEKERMNRPGRKFLMEGLSKAAPYIVVGALIGLMAWVSSFLPN